MWPWFDGQAIVKGLGMKQVKIIGMLYHFTCISELQKFSDKAHIVTSKSSYFAILAKAKIQSNRVSDSSPYRGQQHFGGAICVG